MDKAMIEASKAAVEEVLEKIPTNLSVDPSTIRINLRVSKDRNVGPIVSANASLRLHIHTTKQVYNMQH